MKMIIATVAVFLSISSCTPRTLGDPFGPESGKQAAPLIRLNQSTLVLFQDDFSRRNSPALAGGWTEDNEQLTLFCCTAGGYKYAPGFIELHRQAFAIHFINPRERPNTTYGKPHAYARLLQPAAVFPVTLSFRFTPHADERQEIEIGLMNRRTGFVREVHSDTGEPDDRYLPVNGFGIRLNRSSFVVDNSHISLVKRSSGALTVLAAQAASFQFESGQFYTVTLTINADYSTRLEVSNGESTDVLVSEPTDFIPVLDQLYVREHESGVSDATTSPGHFRILLDDLLVTVPEGL